MAFNGALVKKVANQTTANYTTLTAVAWDTEVYDTNSWHDNATNNTRVTVPSSVNKVRLTAGFFADLISGADRIRLHIYKNGAVLTHSLSGALLAYHQYTKWSLVIILSLWFPCRVIRA
jgi:hypothetical protein